MSATCPRRSTRRGSKSMGAALPPAAAADQYVLRAHYRDKWVQRILDEEADQQLVLEALNRDDRLGEVSFDLLQKWLSRARLARGERRRPMRRRAA